MIGGMEAHAVRAVAATPIDPCAAALAAIGDVMRQFNEFVGSARSPAALRFQQRDAPASGFGAWPLAVQRIDWTASGRSAAVPAVGSRRAPRPFARRSHRVASSH